MYQILRVTVFILPYLPACSNYQVGPTGHRLWSVRYGTAVTSRNSGLLEGSRGNIIIIIINILTAIGLAPGGSSPVHIYREHYIEYTNNTQNT